MRISQASMGLAWLCWRYGCRDTGRALEIPLISMLILSFFPHWYCSRAALWLEYLTRQLVALQMPLQRQRHHHHSSGSPHCQRIAHQGRPWGLKHLGSRLVAWNGNQAAGAGAVGRCDWPAPATHRYAPIDYVARPKKLINMQAAGPGGLVELAATASHVPGHLQLSRNIFVKP